MSVRGAAVLSVRARTANGGLSAAATRVQTAVGPAAARARLSAVPRGAQVETASAAEIKAQSAAAAEAPNPAQSEAPNVDAAGDVSAPVTPSPGWNEPTAPRSAARPVSGPAVTACASASAANATANAAASPALSASADHAAESVPPRMPVRQMALRPKTHCQIMQHQKRTGQTQEIRTQQLRAPQHQLPQHEAQLYLLPQYRRQQRQKP